MNNFLICLFLFVFFCSCNGVGTAEFEGEGTNEEASGMTFAGLSTIDQVSVSSVRLNWTSHSDAVAYKIYRINGTTSTLVTSVAAPASSVVIQGLSANTSYNFKVRAVDASDKTDANSVTRSVTTSGCPLNYILVPHNTLAGTTEDFCVMQYEARAWSDTNLNGSAEVSEIDADGCGDAGCTLANWGLTNKPISTYEGLPWRKINQTNARLLCQSLNASGEERYDLISNPEWMTIALNIEQRNANWSGGAPGNGCVFKGNDGANSACGYDGSNPEGDIAGRDSKARLVLSNGNYIWDFAGNLWEWTNWTVDFDALHSGPANCHVTAIELAQISTSGCTGLLPAEYQPSNISYASPQGMGRFYSSTTGGAAMRGGGYSDTADTGIFSLSLFPAPTVNLVDVGFRCVYRP